jgi:DNA polymerase type B, organellar and viral
MDEFQIRPDHFLKSTVGGRFPSKVVICATSWTERPSPTEVGERVRCMSVFGVQRITRTNGHFSVRHRDFANTPFLARALLFNALGGADLTWVIGYRLSHQLTLIDWWDQISQGNWTTYREQGEEGELLSDGTPRDSRTGKILVLSDPPFIVSGWWNGRRMVGVCSRNYWDCHPAEMPGWIDPDIENIADQSDLEWKGELSVAAELTAVREQVTQSIITLSGVKGASWAQTGAGLAWSAFRGGFLRDREILVHGDYRALKMERSAYYGGRCWPNYVGHVISEGGLIDAGPTLRNLPLTISREEISVLDFSSMYPSIIRDKKLPVRLTSIGHGMGPGKLPECGPFFSAVAHVMIETDRPIFPCRVWGDTLLPIYDSKTSPWDVDINSNHKVIYPVGTFHTLLIGDELEEAFKMGAVKNVYHWCGYESCVIDNGFAETFFALKNAAEAKGDKIGRGLWKLILNGLYGKFGQMSKVWSDAPGVDAVEQWGSWTRINAQSGEIHNLRSIGGHVQRQIDGGESAESCPAIAAAIAAAGRVKLNKLVESIDRRHWLYADTDGVHCLMGGCNGNGGISQGKSAEMGKLRHVRTAKNALYLGKRTYRHDGQWIVSGVARGANWRPWDGWEYDCADGALTIVGRGPHLGVTVRNQRRPATMVDCGGIPGRDGWVIPFEIVQKD